MTGLPLLFIAALSCTIETNPSLSQRWQSRYVHTYNEIKPQEPLTKSQSTPHNQYNQRQNPPPTTKSQSRHRPSRGRRPLHLRPLDRRPHPHRLRLQRKTRRRRLHKLLLRHPRHVPGYRRRAHSLRPQRQSVQRDASA